MHPCTAFSALPSGQHVPLREEACGGDGGETCGAEAGGRRHRRDEGSHGRAPQAVLQPGGGHDPAAAQTAGLCLCTGRPTVYSYIQLKVIRLYTVTVIYSYRS